MGEIKSTLDLVMERTRHLSMSDEERAQQKKSDFQKRLQGLLQQYADGALGGNAVQEKIADLELETGVDDRQLVASALVGRIDPDGENDRWLDLLAAVVSARGSRLRELLVDYRDERGRLAAKSRSRLQAALADRGISGTAVRPNPHRDAAFTEQLDILRRQTTARIQKAISPADNTP